MEPDHLGDQLRTRDSVSDHTLFDENDFFINHATSQSYESTFEQLRKVRERLALSARQSMGNGVRQYGDFAAGIDGIRLEGTVGWLAETAEELVVLSKDILSATPDSPSLKPTRPDSKADGPMRQASTTGEESKLDGWMDELHEAIALRNWERAVEGVDRLRFELKGDSGEASLAGRLNGYTELLEDRLLGELADACMDQIAVARFVHLLQGLGREVEAKDCLLTAHSARISLLSSSAKKLSVIGRTLRAAASVFKRAFPEPFIASGLMVWLEGHILDALNTSSKCASDSEKAEFLGQFKELGYDFDFLL